MPKLLKYISLVIVCSALVLQVLYLVLRSGFRTYNKVEQEHLSHIFNDTSYHDLVFLGSSRTLNHINPHIIDSILGTNSYNAGIAGANIFEMNMILKSYLLKHPAPKSLVLDLSTQAFEIHEQPFFNPTVYFPYLDHSLVYEALGKSKRVFLLKYLPFLQMTEWDDYSKGGVVSGLNGKRLPSRHHYKGYVAMGTDTLKLPFKWVYHDHHFSIHRDGLRLLDEMVDICQSRKIRLILTYSPVYKLNDEPVNPAFFPILESVSKQEKIPYLNYRLLNINTEHRLFRDEYHLNEAGVQIFSAKLARDLSFTLR